MRAGGTPYVHRFREGRWYDVKHVKGYEGPQGVKSDHLHNSVHEELVGQHRRLSPQHDHAHLHIDCPTL